MVGPHPKKKKERKEKKRYRVKCAKIQTGDLRVLTIKKKELEQHKLSSFVLGAQVVKPVTQK